MSGPDALNRDCPDLPLPRWGVLGGKSLCTCRRWRLYFVQLRSFSAGILKLKAEGQLIVAGPAESFKKC
jgi:hypothetical protein